VGPRVARVLGADAAIAVNNNAAAVLLVLTALAAGKEVIVSRGEAVEIGGSFRIPDVITACGARLREVGTTNRTRVADYARVIGPDSGVILRVHPSNFRVEGYTEAPDREALYALAQERGVPLVDDLGSGCLWPGLGERTVGDALGTSDLVTFSGDKLMGGPQAGLIVGRSDLVQRSRKHPLYRALRLDKLVLATLEATWIEIEQERLPPAAGLLRVPVEQLRQRAEALAHSLRDQGVPASGEEDRVPVGGGSAPGEMVPTAVVRVPAANANELAARLRANDPPVVARIRDDALILDLRAVYDGDDALLDEAMARAWHDRPPPAQEEG
jgi:L-seryl-tRNA(Ser) seleniumtransferase